MAWLRLYDDILDDPKVQMLPAIAFRMLINLWCIAKRNGGTIPTNLDTLSFSLRMPVAEVVETLHLLVTNGLIDKAETGYSPHNWQGRQFESDTDGAERMRRYRARNKPSLVTSPLRNAKRHTLRNSDVLDTDTDTDTERRNTEGSVLSSLHSESTGVPPLSSRVAGIQPEVTAPPEPPKPVAEPPPEPAVKAKPAPSTPTPVAPAPAVRKDPNDPWVEVFSRGKQILGHNAGGIITNLRKLYDDKPRKVLAKLEDAAEQRHPAEWINAFLLRVDDGGRLSGCVIGMTAPP